MITLLVAPDIVLSLQTTSAMLADHALLAAVWLFWCVLHSVLISRSWMSRMRRFLDSGIAYYRLFYVTLSILTLVPVLWLQWTIETPLLWAWQFPWTIIQWVGISIALLLIYFGSRQYDNAFFLGIRQIRDHLEERTSEYSGFAASGILRYIRHPYYTAGILFLLFWGNVTPANLIMKVIGIAYLVIGAWLEERKLIAEFGDEYRRYRNAVPMLLPRMPWLRRNNDEKNDV